MTRPSFIIAWAIAAASCSDLDVPSRFAPHPGPAACSAGATTRTKMLELAETEPTRVRVEAGELKGVEDEQVLSFEGVPYAAPPIAELRWRAPRS